MKLLTSGVKDMVSTIWNMPINIWNYFHSATFYYCIDTTLLIWSPASLELISPTTFKNKMEATCNNTNHAKSNSHLTFEKIKKEQTKCFFRVPRGKENNCKDCYNITAWVFHQTFLISSMYFFFASSGFIHPHLKQVGKWEDIHKSDKKTTNLAITMQLRSPFRGSML